MLCYISVGHYAAGRGLTELKGKRKREEGKRKEGERGDDGEGQGLE